MSITIRLATAADAELIADLSRSTFYESFILDNKEEDMEKFLDEQFTHPALMAEVSTPGNIFFLAYLNGEVAGYVRLREDNNPPELSGQPTMEIARIYAKQQMIGKGIGTALMNKSLDIARQKNKKIAWLGVWEHNQRAIDFYIKHGFRKFSEHPFILGNDVQTDWLMKKEL